MMEADERRRRIVLLRSQQAELRQRLDEARDAEEYEEILVDIYAVDVRLRDLGLNSLGLKDFGLDDLGPKDLGLDDLDSDDGLRAVG
jgi:DNA-binding MarR family transcriptional regulator